VTSKTNPTERLKEVTARGGVWYATLFVCRAVADRVRDSLDELLAAIERKKNLVEPWTISARRFTPAEQRALYNAYDWSKQGEEWTVSAEWKQGLIDEFLIPNVPEGGVVLEIGPGGGRWTEILQRRAGRLVLADVSDQALANCRERFRGCANIEYLLGDGRTLRVADSSLDAIWSYDVFVHVNPVNARSYVREFARILRPGSRAVIHHPGSERHNPSRSDLTDAMMAAFCAEAGLDIVVQTSKFALGTNRGDVLSLIQKPA
jgi:ubiquinone/menaquinone biosynthesis C-methylase UbiE